MKHLLVVLCLFAVSASFSQEILTVPFDKAKAILETANKKSIKLYQVKKINFLKQDGNLYQCVFYDETNNPLQGFLIIQYDRSSFFKNLKDAIKSLGLTDTNIIAKIDSLFETNDENDLHTQFLMAKERASNTDVLAGTLTIKKNSVMHITEASKHKIMVKAEAARWLDSLNLYIDTIPKVINAARALQSFNKEDSTRLAGILDLVNDAKRQAQTQLDSSKQPIPASEYIDHCLKAVRLMKTAHAAAVQTLSIPGSGTKSMRVDTTAKENKLSAGIISKEFIFSNAVYSETLAPPINGAQGENNPTENTEYKKKDYVSIDFIVHKVKLQIEDGFIENLLVYGHIKGDNQELKFGSSSPIPFSVLRDFRKLIDIKLFEKSNYIKNFDYYVSVGEILSYDPNFQNENKDYCPANNPYIIDLIKDEDRKLQLFKDQTTKILELKVFSDLKGAGEENPNGLIQLEFSRRFNFLSKRHNVTRDDIWILKCLQNKMSLARKYESLYNYGWFNYVTPQFSLNKIEQTNRNLILSHDRYHSISNDGSKPITFASTLDILRHQIYKVGFDLSTVYVDLRSHKSTINFGMGLHFGRSAIQDTIRTKDGNAFPFHKIADNNVDKYEINTFQWGPFMTWQIYPDTRFGVSATQRFTWYKALTTRFVQVRDTTHYQNFIAPIPNGEVLAPYSYYNYGQNGGFITGKIISPLSLFTKCIASSEIYAFFKFDEKTQNKLFFRYRLNWDLLNSRYNYHQLQVGFSMCLDATKEFKNLKTAYDTSVDGGTTSK